MTNRHEALRAATLALIALTASSVAPTHVAPRPAHTERTERTCVSNSHPGAPHFSAGALRDGRFVYRETTHGEDTATFTVEIRRRADDTWRFTGEGSGQRWEAITDSLFHPRSAMLSMMRRGHPYEFRLRYTSDSVFALVTRYDSAAVRSEERSAAAIGDATIDQRIDWASLMSSDLTVGQAAAYLVFDPATGSSQLSATASDGPALAGPDGPQATTKLEYTICKAGRSESYTVFATKGEGRVMLREDLRGNSVVELVRADR